MKTKQGFPVSDWDAAKIQAKTLLGQHARKRQMITYSDFVGQLRAISIEAHDSRLHVFLEEVSEEEAKAGRGMLTALVVHKVGDMQPGDGFFNLAKRLGRDTTDIVKCWIEEVKTVFRAWAS